MHLLYALVRKSSFSKAQGFMKPAPCLVYWIYAVLQPARNMNTQSEGWNRYSSLIHAKRHALFCVHNGYLDDRDGMRCVDRLMIRCVCEQMLCGCDLLWVLPCLQTVAVPATAVNCDGSSSYHLAVGWLAMQSVYGHYGHDTSGAATGGQTDRQIDRKAVSSVYGHYGHDTSGAATGGQTDRQIDRKAVSSGSTICRLPQILYCLYCCSPSLAPDRRILVLWIGMADG